MSRVIREITEANPIAQWSKAWYNKQCTDMYRYISESCRHYHGAMNENNQ